jgi:hypothetical protein
MLVTDLPDLSGQDGGAVQDLGYRYRLRLQVPK